MARFARVVVPGIPHHIVQRGVRSMDIFTCDDDRRVYLGLVRECALRHHVSLVAWCLMTNHSHLVGVPEEHDSLAKALGEVARRYARLMNAREGVTGHFFQERYFSYPIQTDGHLVEVVRYVELNPVRAGLADQPESYAWSSAKHHLTNARDPLIDSGAMRDLLPSSSSWQEYLREGRATDHMRAEIERRLSTGRPLGTKEWIAGLENQLDRTLAPKRPGPRSKIR